MNIDLSEYAAGLRKLADAMDADAALGLPWTGCKTEFVQYCDSREQMAAWVALLDDPVDHGVTHSNVDWYRVTGRIHGIRVVVLAQPKHLGGVPVSRTVETYEVEPFLTATVGA